MDINVEFNNFQIVLLSGKVSSVEREERDGHKYIRFFLKHTNDKYNLSISTYLFDNGCYEGLKSGDSVMVKGKLRYNELKEKYKLMGVSMSIVPETVNVNVAIIEGLCVNKAMISTGLMTDFRSYNLKKSVELEYYFLPFQVFFNSNRAFTVDRMIDRFTSYFIEGKLKYDADSKSFMLIGEHVKSSVPVTRQITVEV